MTAKSLPAVVCLAALAGLVLMATVQPWPAVVVAGGIALIAVAGIRRAAAGCFVAAMGTAPLNVVGFGGASLNVTVSDLLFVAGIVLGLPQLFGHRLRLPIGYVAGATILVTAGFLASLAAVDTVGSLIDLVRLMFVALLLPMIVAWWTPNVQMIVVMAAAFMTGQVVNFLYAKVDSDPWQHIRAYGLTTHFNNYALIALLCLAWVPFMAPYATGRWQWLLWAGAAACGYSVWESGSRAALLAGVVVGALVIVLERWGRAAWLAVTGAAVMVMLWSSVAQSNPNSALGRLLGGSASANSDRERSDALKLGWRSFTDHPLIGSGFVDVTQFHNVYLAVGAAAGVFALAGFLIMLGSAAGAVLRLPHPVNRLGYAVIAYAMFAALSTNLWDRFAWIPVVFVLAAWRLAMDQDQDRAEAAPSSQVRVAL